MTVSTIARRVVGSSWLTMNGLPIDVPWSDARVSSGFDQPITTAQFTVPFLTSRLALNTPINMFLGAAQIGQPLQQSNSFAGYIVGYQPSYYPRGVTVMCEGPLTLASHFKPDFDVDFTGYTDVTAIKACLLACGIETSRQIIFGLGTPLGVNSNGVLDERFFWRKGQTGLDFILSIDQISLGFRTYDWGGSGIVFRRIITSQTYVDPSLIFSEHIDVSGGSGEWTLDQGAVGVEVQGAMGPSGSQIVAGLTRSSLGTGFIAIPSDKIESQAQADDIAAWAQIELGRPLARLQFTTYRNEDVRPGMTIFLAAINRLMLSRRVWVQNVVRELTEGGQFQQTVTVLSEVIEDTNPPAAPGVEQTPGGDLQPDAAGPDMSTPPYDALADPIADFTFEFIDHEFTDTGTEFWIVIVRSSAYSNMGSITTYAWTTSAVTVPDTGAAALFAFKTTDITSTVTLTVTDSAANSAAITKACNSSEALEVTRDRHLYASSGGANAIAYDGANHWRTQAVSGGDTDVVANGPIWANGVKASLSQDDLATAPNESTVFSGQNVSALWCETDINASQIYAGGSAGGVARSEDGGDTFTVLTSASANAVLRIIASRYNPGEVLLMDSAGVVYQSLDGGISWSLIATHTGAVDLAQSNFRNWVGGSFGVKVMESGASATWPGSTPNIVAIAAHIRDDILYALASDGTTYYTSPAGGLAFVAGASLPSGTAQARGMTRDGAGVDLLYIAAGSKIWKQFDGLRTSACYVQIYGAAAVSVGYGDFPLTGSGTVPGGDLFELAGVNFSGRF